MVCECDGCLTQERKGPKDHTTAGSCRVIKGTVCHDNAGQTSAATLARAACDTAL